MLALLISATACNSSRPTLPGEVQSVVFKTLTGKQLQIRTLDAPVLVSFWSTRCTICLYELPELAKLYRTFQRNEFEMIAVAIPEDRPDHVLQTAEAGRWPFHVALDINGTVIDAFGQVKGTPTSFLFDRDGTLVTRYVGAVDISALESELVSLLSQ